MQPKWSTTLLSKKDEPNQKAHPQTGRWSSLGCGQGCNPTRDWENMFPTCNRQNTSKQGDCRRERVTFNTGCVSCASWGGGEPTRSPRRRRRRADCRNTLAVFTAFTPPLAPGVADKAAKGRTTPLLRSAPGSSSPGPWVQCQPFSTALLALCPRPRRVGGAQPTRSLLRPCCQPQGRLPPPPTTVRRQSLWASARAAPPAWSALSHPAVRLAVIFQDRAQKETLDLRERAKPVKFIL